MKQSKNKLKEVARGSITVSDEHQTITLNDFSFEIPELGWIKWRGFREKYKKEIKDAENQLKNYKRQ